MQKKLQKLLQTTEPEVRNMKLSKREVNLLLVFFGVLIVFLAYRFVYVKMNDKAEELAQQSAAMET